MSHIGQITHSSSVYICGKSLPRVCPWGTHFCDDDAAVQLTGLGPIEFFFFFGAQKIKINFICSPRFPHAEDQVSHVFHTRKLLLHVSASWLPLRGSWAEFAGSRTGSAEKTRSKPLYKQRTREWDSSLQNRESNPLLWFSPLLISLGLC